MCDTVVVRRAGGTWFAKNSDREPGEPQAVRVVRPPRDGGSGRVRATWIEVDAPPRRLAAVLSQPVWMWGAEMGVNEAGVAIGNEAIFSRARTREPGLLGMDLLRLGLECGDTARGAVEVLTALLEAHGQGGRAGYHDARFHYDNSFLVADASEAWQLETSGRDWAARRVTDQQGISNALSIRGDHELAAATVGADADVAREWDTALMPRLAGARSRATATTRAASRLGPSPSLGELAAILRQHRDPDGDPVHGSNRDVCMHAMGPVRRSQTTGSLVAHLAPRRSARRRDRGVGAVPVGLPARGADRSHLVRGHRPGPLVPARARAPPGPARRRPAAPGPRPRRCRRARGPRGDRGR